MQEFNFPSPFVQAPLAGVSCAPFRVLAWQHGAPAFTYTEMISCKTLLKPHPDHKRYWFKDPREGALCFQLSGNDPRELGEAVQRATEYGADLIDLNCGCPVKKIRSKGSGSKLLTEPQTLFQLITAMKQNTHLPVSIKIRVEGKSNDRFHHELITVIKESGVDFITVHGRHWTEHYETPCQHEHIAFFANELTIPVIGNGDVSDFASLQTMLKTGCQGVMIGRAGVGQPWLSKQLLAALQGTSFTPPTAQEVGQYFLQHIRELAALLNNETLAILQARQLGKYYARSLRERAAWISALQVCQDLKTVEKWVSHYFNSTSFS